MKNRLLSLWNKIADEELSTDSSIEFVSYVIHLYLSIFGKPIRKNPNFRGICFPKDKWFKDIDKTIRGVARIEGTRNGVAVLTYGDYVLIYNVSKQALEKIIDILIETDKD